MAWIYLIVAGLFEIVWAIGIKYTEGFSKFWPSVGTVLAMIVSFYLLAKAVKELPIGTAYAVWVGIGASGAALFGILFLGEPYNLSRLFFLGLLVVAIIGLKLSTSS